MYCINMFWLVFGVILFLSILFLAFYVYTIYIKNKIEDELYDYSDYSLEIIYIDLEEWDEEDDEEI